MNEGKNICPICGYDSLEVPPDLGEICPCCGTEFGFTDVGISHPELLKRWLARGAKWWSQASRPPMGWSPLAQLKNVGYVPTNEEYALLK